MRSYTMSVIRDRLNENLGTSWTKEDMEAANQALEDYWYANYPDYSKYSSPEYMLEALYSCQYSIQYVKALAKLYPHPLESIVDYGAGLGESTNLLQDLYPKATVYYYNLPGAQTNYFRKYGNPLVHVITNPVDLPDADCYVLFEVMEHVVSPWQELDMITPHIKKLLCCSNRFNVLAYGHHKDFTAPDGTVVDQHKMARVFNKHLATKYDRLPIKVFNGMPGFWQKKEENK